MFERKYYKYKYKYKQLLNQKAGTHISITILDLSGKIATLDDVELHENGDIELYEDCPVELHETQKILKESFRNKLENKLEDLHIEADYVIMSGTTRVYSNLYSWYDFDNIKSIFQHLTLVRIPPIHINGIPVKISDFFTSIINAKSDEDYNTISRKMYNSEILNIEDFLIILKKKLKIYEIVDLFKYFFNIYTHFDVHFFQRLWPYLSIYIYRGLPKIYKKNKDILMSAIEHNGDGISDIISYACDIISYASDDLKDNEEIGLLAVSKNGHNLQYLSKRVRGIRYIVEAAVGQNGDSISHASDTLKDDEEIVMLAVSQNGHNLLYASKRVRGIRDIVIKAVRMHGASISYASDPLKDDEEIVMLAVLQDGHNLQYASERVRGIKDIVKAAVNQNGISIYYASDELKADDEIIKLSVL